MNTELNERVAEELMGWTRPANALPGGEWELIQYAGGRVPERMEHTSGRAASVSVAEFRADKWWQAPNGTYHEHPPNYSGDWAAFGELLEKLRCVSTITPSPISLLISAKLVRARVYGGLAQDRDVRVALCQAALGAAEEEGNGDT